MNKVLKRNIFAIYASELVLGTFFQLPIWIVYQSQFLSFSQIAFYSGVSLAVEVLMQLPTGAFADMYGRKISLSLGNLFLAIPMFLIAFYPSQEIMFTYAILWGLGRAFCMGTSKPMLYETLVKYKKVELYPKILSQSVLFFQLSAAFSIATGGYLYQISNNLPYIISGSASLVGVFSAFLFKEFRDSQNKFIFKSFIETSKNGFKEIFKTKFVTQLTILYALTLGIANTSQQFFAQPYMVEIGMSDIQRSWVAMIIKVLIAYLGMRMINKIRIFNNKYFLLIIPVIMIISLIPAGYVMLPASYLFLIGIAFISGNTDLFYSSEIQLHLDSKVRSTAVSLQRMIASAFGTAIQWVSAFIIPLSGVGVYYSYLGLFSLFVIMPLALVVVHNKHKVYLKPDTLVN